MNFHGYVLGINAKQKADCFFLDKRLFEDYLCFNYSCSDKEDLDAYFASSDLLSAFS